MAGPFPSLTEKRCGQWRNHSGWRRNAGRNRLLRLAAKGKPAIEVKRSRVLKRMIDAARISRQGQLTNLEA